MQVNFAGSFVERNSGYDEAQGNLKPLKELDKQVSQVALVLDGESLAQRVLDTIVDAHNAKGAVLCYRPRQTMLLAYRTPEWSWEEGDLMDQPVYALMDGPLRAPINLPNEAEPG